ncbi:DUF1345 domain-containing protein [Sandaracinobacteroides saxicola]|uniref:DUF1345 domain-containing protein n=1 Tax=Sandaracinobacteroides saxicola TaxID=2759707 RepID=A0A7G5IID9_9SPHN|nr:DUF1345 domain-containing protein [Sandaracinobacteroides saxicola]QMW23131.1 DUF1345 domain-containing protein [Sandaracinobacteroides saxicola]
MGSRIAPPRFVMFVLLFLGGVALLWPLGVARAVMLGFDAAALAFLLSCLPFLRRHSADELRKHAAANDANRPMLLAVTAATMAAILTAVGVEIGGSDPWAKPLIVATLALAWLFSNSIYALHYAHLYYRRGSEGGLGFSGDGDPDYGDFVYFAFTLGMTFQTSDTEVTTPAMRRAVTLHCLAAFVFNIGVVAFTVNVLGAGR